MAPPVTILDGSGVWYGKFDAARASRWGGANDGGAMQWGALVRLRDDVLLESLPEEVPLSAKQMPRENIQECEARIFLEGLFLESPSRLPTSLCAKAQAVLDERTRWHRMLMLNPAPESSISWPCSGWETRSIQLYEAAAEAAQAIGAKQDLR